MQGIERAMGMRLLREARLLPPVCNQSKCELHPWFYLPGGHLRHHALYNHSLRAGWVGGGCLANNQYAKVAVRARRSWQ